MTRAMGMFCVEGMEDIPVTVVQVLLKQRGIKITLGFMMRIHHAGRRD